MDWSLIIGSSGLAGVAYLIFKMGRFTQKMESFVYETKEMFIKIDERFDKIDQRFDKIDQKFEKIENHLHSIDIRLTVLEAEQIIYNVIPDQNARSEAAKEVWKKRKQKALANLSGEK